MEAELGDLQAALEDDEVVEQQQQQQQGDPFLEVRGCGDGRAAILGALEEAILEERGVAGASSATEVFAAIMTTLEAASKNAAASSRRGELLGLLVLALPATRTELLRSKFDLIANVLVKAMNAKEVVVKKKRKEEEEKEEEEDEEGASVAKHSVRALTLVLSRQEASGSAWKAPSKLRALEAVLRCAGDKRPKVRKAAVAGMVDLLTNCGGREARGALSKRLSQWTVATLSQLTTARRPVMTSTAHLIQLVVAAAPLTLASSQGAVAEALLEQLITPPSDNSEERWRLEALAIRGIVACGADVTKTLLAVRGSTLAQSAEVRRSWAEAVAGSGAGSADTLAEMCAELLVNKLGKSFFKEEWVVTALASLANKASTATLRRVFAKIISERPKEEAYHKAIATMIAEIVNESTEEVVEAVLSSCVKSGASNRWYGPAFEAAIFGLGLRGFLGLVGKSNATLDSATFGWLVPVLKKALVKNAETPGVHLEDLLEGIAPFVPKAAWTQLGALFVAQACDLEDRLPTLQLRLVALLSTADNAEDLSERLAMRRAACDCAAALPRGSSTIVAASARVLLPHVFAATMDRAENTVVDSMDDSFEQSAVAAVETLSLCADRTFVQTVFKKLVKRLLESVAESQKSSKKPSRKRGAEDMDEEEGSSKPVNASVRRAVALCGCAAAMVPALEPAALDVLWRATKPLVEVGETDVALQKRAYKIILALCDSKEWLLSSESGGLSEVMEALVRDGSLHACHVACRERRLRVLTAMVDASSGTAGVVERMVVPLAGEVILCLKDANARARQAAFATLDAMARVCSRQQQDNELPRILVGALGARTPHMRSAAMVALARVCYEHRVTLLPTFPSLLETAFLLLRDKAREVAKATIAFVHVLVLALAPTPDMLLPLLPKLVQALMLWAHEKKARFRAKIKLVLRRLCRTFGHDAILPLVPTEDLPLVQHLKRAAARAAAVKTRKRAEAASFAKTTEVKMDVEEVEEQEEAAFDEDELFRDDFEEDVGGDSSDEEAEEKNSKMKKKAANNNNNLSMKRATNNGQQPNKKQRRLQEKSGEVLDLLGPSRDADKAGKMVGDDDETGQANVTFDAAGKMVVGDGDLPPVAKSTTGFKSRPIIRNQQKRTGKRGDLRDKRLTRKTKAGGDVQKHGALEPFSWAPLGDLARKKPRTN